MKFIFGILSKNDVLVNAWESYEIKILDNRNCLPLWNAVDLVLILNSEQSIPLLDFFKCEINLIIIIIVYL